jgi:aerobic-type carbon monoxide dehydrogenase small subunit (CoxS/CutS family)
MTDQQPGGPGNSGSWQPVPGGGDYDPDQTMHVSFAAQLPPEPAPGEDPLGAHGPAGDGTQDPAHYGGPGDANGPAYGQPGGYGYGDPGGPDGGRPGYGEPVYGAPAGHGEPLYADSAGHGEPVYGDPAGHGGPAGGAEAEAVTSWSIPVIREDTETDSGEFSVGAFAPPSWDQVPSPAAPTQSFPAGMFGQGAAAAQAAQARSAQQEAPPGHDQGAGGDLGRGTGQWEMPFTGPEGGDAVPWLPAHAPAADAAWSGAVDDPESPQRQHASEADDPQDADGPARRSPQDVYGAGTGPRQDGSRTEELAGDEPPAGDDPGTPDLHDGQDHDLRDQDFPAHDLPPHDLPDGDAPDGEGPDAEATDGADGPDALAGPAEPDGDDPFAVPDETALSEGGFEVEVEAEPEPEPVEETHSEHPLASYMLRVNGTDRPVTDAWLGESLLYVLRERLGLAGAKDGCEQGECGACSVQVDGRLVASCLVPAATAAGSEVRTVEGLTVDGRPSDVQRALAESGAVQCGFCIPGMAMTVHDLLEGNHKPTDLDVRQALSGNLCRCSGYRGVLDAVREVVTGREAEDEPAADDQLRVPHQGGPTGTAGDAL